MFRVSKKKLQTNYIYYNKTERQVKLKLPQEKIIEIEIRELFLYPGLQIRGLEKKETLKVIED